jgi:hypothetical protein
MGDAQVDVLAGLLDRVTTVALPVAQNERGSYS